MLLPRHVSLHCGIPIGTPALGVNRLCGSGFQAVVNGAQDIILGAAKIALTGGVDNMSQTPFTVRNIRFGTALGQSFNFEDSLWESLGDTYCKLKMGQTAENLGVKYNIPRADVDEFALRSQNNWQAANEAGVFKEEITPITLKVKGKEIQFFVDEHPK